jgi:hypothetical protein
VPWILAVYAGRVNIDTKTGAGSYSAKPKYTAPQTTTQLLFETGVNCKPSVGLGGKLMVITRYA